MFPHAQPYIYIDAGGTYKTRTIMRAEQVAIYMILHKFAAQDWVGIFTDSLSGLEAIRHRYINPGAPPQALNTITTTGSYRAA